MAKTITAPRYNCLDSDINVTCNATSNAIQVRLPKASTNAGKSIRIAKSDSSANAVTIISQRTDTLDDGTRQVETATVVGTVVNAGNATVVLTSANLAESPITVSVAVKSGDTASVVAGKIREALTMNALIGVAETGAFTVSGSGATVVLTSVDYLSNDSTLNLSIDNGTCTGLTTAATSADTTAGSSVTLTVQNDFKLFTSDGNSWITAETSGLTDTQTLTNKTLTSPTLTTPRIVNNGYIADDSGNEYLKFSKTTNAVNEITVGNAATSGVPNLTATGGDTNIPIHLRGKGSGAVYLGQSSCQGVLLYDTQPLLDTNANELIKFVAAANAVNEVTITNSPTNVEPTISATGSDSNISVAITGKGTGGVNVGAKVKITAEGGIAVKMTNKTGGASVKGEVVTVYTATAVNSAVAKIVVDVPAPIGVFYESGVADGSEAWVVVSGIADVYFIGNTALGNLARGFITGDAGYVTGQALAEAVPSSPFASDKHFYEIGHVIEARTGAGLAKCVLHFN